MTGIPDLAADGLRNHTWSRFLRGPDAELLEDLYVPALSRAVRYDRCCAYFSSSVLAAAARGFGGLIRRLLELGDEAPRPSVRLLVNEELSKDDVRVLRDAGDTTALADRLAQRLIEPADALSRDRLAMLGWLAQSGLLEVRVGVMRAGRGILHAKFGVITDVAGDALVFSGSGNESAMGLVANYEQLEVSPSWTDPDRLAYYRDQFERLWEDRDSAVHAVTLPEAVKDRLIKFAPPEPPIVEPSGIVERQRAAMRWRFATEALYLENGALACDVTAMVSLWPHQRRVVEETAAAWPEGRLLCDEVGMGKTIEAVLVLRRLLAGRGVARALLLLPAGLLRQWQAELREKGALVVPRLEGSTLIWPDGREEKVADLREAADTQPLLLVSREMARLPAHREALLQAQPWDLVLLDEAHAARRAKQEEGEFNSGTLLLDLLRALQLRRRARGIFLLSATPMQTQPWEPWDLLTVLGEGGPWLAEFDTVRRYYRTIGAVGAATVDMPSAERTAELIASDPAFPLPPNMPRERDNLRDYIVFPPPGERDDVARWLRQGAPLGRRLHRNTRDTLRGYHRLGLLAQPPPGRRVDDIVFDYEDPAERAVYDAVTTYIERRYSQLEAEKPGKGFVMTIYRRRAASSPYALKQSLHRRQEGLERVVRQQASDLWLSADDDVDPSDLADLGEAEETGRVSSALPTDPEVAKAELREVERLLERLDDLRERDSKRDHFTEVLRRLTSDGRAVLVFTEYTDTMTYLRDWLVSRHGEALGCYSGAGGQMLRGGDWVTVSKSEITDALRSGQVRVLLCTDAASEGLNLQAAGALINYDLPWNPSRVEQRIGRIDRIGQPLPLIPVVNLFLHDSVDQRVYELLRERCGLFEHFVGPMQPVLAAARRMLVGSDSVDTSWLAALAEHTEADELAAETYVESEAIPETDEAPPLTLENLIDAFRALDGIDGLQVREHSSVSGLFTFGGDGRSALRVGAGVEALERDPQAVPLNPLHPRLAALADRLTGPGERLPLVVVTCQRGAFRRSVALWAAVGGSAPVTTYEDLQARLKAWDGTLPTAEAIAAAQERGESITSAAVDAMEACAVERERAGLHRQREAARIRLVRELGRYLVAHDYDANNLNQAFHVQMTRDSPGAERVRRVYDRLGGYPDWDERIRADLRAFRRTLLPNKAKSRQIGVELEAALQDPRWQVQPG